MKHLEGIMVIFTGLDKNHFQHGATRRESTDRTVTSARKELHSSKDKSIAACYTTNKTINKKVVKSHTSK